MRDWATEILNYPRCTRVSLLLESDAMSCPDCGARYGLRDDVTDFLVDANPVVVRERSAVATLDKKAPDSSLTEWRTWFGQPRLQTTRRT